MIDTTDIALMGELPGSGEFDKFQPFNLRQLFHKGGGDGKIKETEDEKAFAEVVSQKWNHYKAKYGEVEQKYMDKVDSLDSEGAANFAKGSANQHTQAAFSKAQEGVRDSHTMAGLNPNSGASKAKMHEFSSSEGEAAGENMARAENSQKDQHIAGISNVVAMGQGKSTEATAGLGGLADSSADKAASDATKAFNDSAMNQQAVGTVAGAVASHYGLGDSAPKASGFSMNATENQTAAIGLNYGEANT